MNQLIIHIITCADFRGPHLLFRFSKILPREVAVSSMSKFFFPEEDVNLMCHVIMDDSFWLDSFQKSILVSAHHSSFSTPDPTSSISNPLSREQPELEIKAVNNDTNTEVSIHRLRRSKSHEVLRFHSVHAFESRTIDAPTTVVDQLPAPEFVDGTRSMIACESFRMISTVAAMHGSNSANYRRFDNV